MAKKIPMKKRIEIIIVPIPSKIVIYIPYLKLIITQAQKQITTSAIILIIYTPNLGGSPLQNILRTNPANKRVNIA